MRIQAVSVRCSLIPAVLAVCLVVTSCGRADPIAPPPDHQSDAIEGAWQLPLDVLLRPEPTAEESIFDAVQHAIGQCMSDLRFTYQPAPYIPERYPDFYGIASADRAAATGYRPPQPPATEDSVGVGADPNTPGFQEALFGAETEAVEIRSPDNGDLLARIDPASCLGSGTATIRPDWAEQLQLTDQLRSLIGPSSDAADDSPVVQEAWELWADCMSERGYAFATPWAPYYSVWPGDEPGAEEIATAVADVECKEATNTIPIWSRELARIQEEMLAEVIPGVLDRWVDLRDADLRRVGA